MTDRFVPGNTRFLVNIRFILILMVFFVSPVVAQKILYLRPSLGLQFLTDHAIKLPADDNFRYNNFQLYPDFGLHLQFDVNKKYSFFTGWNNGGVGYSFSFRGEDNRSSSSHSSVIPAQRFPFGIQIHLATSTWGRSKKRLQFFQKSETEKENVKNESLYLFVFRTRLILGTTIDYTYRTEENELQSRVAAVADWEYTYRLVNQWSTSVFIGLNLQFFTYNKNHFQLIFFYSQGIQRKVEVDLNYTRLDGSEYRAKLGSRGSYINLQLAYPFKLKEFK